PQPRDALTRLDAVRREGRGHLADPARQRAVADVPALEAQRRLGRRAAGLLFDPLRQVQDGLSGQASVTSSTSAIAVSPAAQPVNRPKPPPRSASSSITSMIERVPIGACGWPQTREQPKLFIVRQSMPLARANSRSLIANGLCVLMAAIWSMRLPACARARCAAGTVASGM